MDYRRTSQRRRRVALDQNQMESIPATAANADPRSANEPRSYRPYTPSARRSRQPKTTDLIPKRYRAIAILIALLILGLVGLNLLHNYSPNWIAVIGENGVNALSLNSDRGIAVWYSNFLLLLTSCVSFQLYLLRQHRRDDYRGTYRIWLWLTGLFLLSSMACISGVFQMVSHTIGYIVQNDAGRGFTLLLTVKLVGITLLVARGMFEVRRSLAAVAALAVVFFAYSMASLIEIPQIQTQAENYFEAAQGNLLLLGGSALLLTLLLYARFVYLQANGRIATQVSAPQPCADEATKRKKRPGRSEKSSTAKPVVPAVAEANRQETASRGIESNRDRKSKSKRRNKPADESAAGKASQRSTRQLERENSQVDTSDDDDHENSGLSKSERRRQRKLKRRQEKRAA